MERIRQIFGEDRQNQEMNKKTIITALFALS